MLTSVNLIAFGCILIVTVEDLTIVDAIIEGNVTEYNTSLHASNTSESIGDSETEATVKNKTDDNTGENITKTLNTDESKVENETTRLPDESEAENKMKAFTDEDKVKNESKIENETKSPTDESEEENKTKSLPNESNIENETKYVVEYKTITEINKVNPDSATTRESTNDNITKSMYEENDKEHETSEENTRFERILVRQSFNNNLPENMLENTSMETMKSKELNDNSIKNKSRKVPYVSVAEDIAFIKENITKDYVNLNTTGTNPDNNAIRCLWCNSRTVFGCYDPLGQKVAVRKCEAPTSLCFTRFGADGEEVERDCFSQQTVDVTHACASNLCNDIPASSIPLIYNRVVWKDYLRSLHIFMKRNTIPLRCVSCESSDSQLNNFTSKSNDDDCANPPKDRVQNMSIECRRNELCETASVRGHVTRGCARVPNDSAFLVCAEDECNNHVDIVQEYHYRKRQYPGYRSKGWKLRSNNTILYICCLIIFCTGS